MDFQAMGKRGAFLDVLRPFNAHFFSYMQFEKIADSFPNILMNI
jgi:hypothetical protein